MYPNRQLVSSTVKKVLDMGTKISSGLVHDLPVDLAKAEHY